MGFSWSSAVAQDVTMGVLLQTGFPEAAIICDSEELPSDDAELAVIATDDTLFLHRDPIAAAARLEAFDAALAASGIPRAVEKDISLASRMTGLGCEISASPPLVSPDAAKLHWLLLASLGLDLGGRASPRCVHSALGVSNWLCILSRPHFSCFDDAYRFVLREPPESVTAVPRDVRNEFVLFASLAALLPAALDREWLPLVAATDAAPEYGFGTSVRELPCDRIAEIGRKAERRGDFVRLDRLGDAEDEPERPRLGRPHRLGLQKSDFKDVLSLQASKPEHAGIMELKGVLLSLRWLLRAARRYHKRIVMLIDAKAALCAVAKGRTNAPAFRRTLCSINALLLASDTLLRPIYVPSEDNPADAPSRGRRRRPVRRRVLNKLGFSKTQRELHHELQRMRMVDELLRIGRPTASRDLKASLSVRSRR
jgi:hypothetical protein